MAIKVVLESAEHQFLTFLDRLKVNPSGWIACTYPFSKKIIHETLIGRKGFIKSDLTKLRLESLAFLEELRLMAENLPAAHIFHFSDNDIILLCCPVNELEQKQVRETLEKTASKFENNFVDYGFLTKELNVYQKLADHKFLTQKRIAAYEALSDESAVASLGVRRKRREDPLVLVVEDDRFTASYISNFLKDFDVVVAKSGEMAIEKYIECAPDAVFLDIHLPGINGHETLQAIKSVDPQAFVVMLSVDTTKASILSASERGAISYLKKPFSKERVLNTLRLSPFIRDSRGILPLQTGA